MRSTLQNRLSGPNGQESCAWGSHGLGAGLGYLASRISRIWKLAWQYTLSPSSEQVETYSVEHCATVEQVNTQLCKRIGWFLNNHMVHMWQDRSIPTRIWLPTYASHWQLHWIILSLTPIELQNLLLEHPHPSVHHISSPKYIDICYNFFADSMLRVDR